MTLEEATTDELFLELAHRHESVILATVRRDEADNEIELFRLRRKGGLFTLRGLCIEVCETLAQEPEEDYDQDVFDPTEEA